MRNPIKPDRLPRMEEVRNKVYEWSLELVREGKILQGIFLMLATWNFAYFRYHMKAFNLGNFEKVLNGCDFDYFRKKTFHETDLDDTDTSTKIKGIYKALADIKGIRYVGATKVMHLMCPKFFVMWDNEIRKHYKVGTSPDEYLKFMREMRTRYDNGEFEDLTVDEGITIPRLIDVHNMTNISTQ